MRQIHTTRDLDYREHPVTITREEAIAIYRHAEDIRVLVEMLLVSLNRWQAVVAAAPFLREKKKGKKKREKRTIAPKRLNARRSK